MTFMEKMNYEAEQELKRADESLEKAK